MKRHPLEIFSLVSGVVFGLFAAVYLLLGPESVPSPAITLPLLLVGLGGAGLAAAVAAQRRTDQT